VACKPDWLTVAQQFVQADAGPSLALRTNVAAPAPLNSSVRHVMKRSRQDDVWNRACLESGGGALAAGDRALAALLLAHGLAMNGGVVHAMGCLTKSQLAAAIAGFNHFGLTAASSVFEQAPDGSEEAEERLNRMYWQAVPNDETLAHAFRIKLVAFPDAFAPVESGAHV